MKQNKIDGFCEFAEKYLHEKNPLTLWWPDRYENKDHVRLWGGIEMNGEDIHGTYCIGINKIKNKKSWPSLLDKIAKKIGDSWIDTFFGDQPYHLQKIHGKGYVKALRKAKNTTDLKDLYTLSYDQKKSLK